MTPTPPRKRVYISGPMTGIDDLNVPAFNAAAAALEDAGYQVFNPAAHGVVEGWEWADYLKLDLRELLNCDAFYTLPGWEVSKGASLEVHVAKQLGLEWLNAPENDLPALVVRGADVHRFADGSLLSQTHIEGGTDAKTASPVGEVRVTSSTGGQKGKKPQAYDLIPWDAMDHVAEVYGFGASKYADHNWRKKYAWSLSIASAFRHMAAFARGEDRDPESGLPHPAHAVFHMFALLAWFEDPDAQQFDDRYKVGR